MEIIKFRWSTALSIGIAVFSLIFAIYSHVSNQKEREPTYLATKGLLVYAKHSDIKSQNYKMIRVNDVSETPLENNVYVQELAFWNKGGTPIEHQDILEPLSFDFPEGYDVIDVFVSKSTRPRIVEPKVSFNRNKVNFDFRILEKGDGFKVQVIFTGNEYIKPMISGVIKQSTGFDSKNELTAENFMYGLGVILIYAFGIIFIGIILVFVIIGFELLLNKVSTKNRDALLKQMAKTGQFVMVALVSSALISVTAIKVVSVAEEEAVNSVPEMEEITLNKAIQKVQ